MSKTLNVQHTKKQSLPFFLLFSLLLLLLFVVTVFIVVFFEQTGLSFVWISLSLSLFDVNDERGFWWWWWFYARCFCLCCC